jgi:hypothetical protein
MHVDGGAMAQVFVYPIGLDFEALAVEYDAQRARTLYVIRNSVLTRLGTGRTPDPQHRGTRHLLTDPYAGGR